MNDTNDVKPANFLQRLIQQDLEQARYDKIITRFPPEPNGYLHIGHAKSICLNFGLAEQFGGHCNLRFDDTNPEKERAEYVAAIQRDIQWLGFQWHGEVKYTSDYFAQLYQWALYLIEQGLAYVCDLSPEQAREYRGTLTKPGVNSPYRERSVAENLELFAKMRAGEFAEGQCSLRAKIDMAASNINLRDPVLYRIKHASHHHTGDQWHIYPAYDFAHGQSDAIEGITHSICTLEFEDHRPLYDWLIEHLPVPSRPQQYEFARLNIDYTVTSKRLLKQLVDEGHVSGWDDPRLPTLSGLRRRGYTPAAIRQFCDLIGVTRADSVVDMSMLEYSIRDDLNKNAPRAMCVLRPLKLIINNYPDAQHESLQIPNHPERQDLGSRTVPFCRELYIDQSDFRETANKHYKRLVLGKRVRLRNAYVIEAERVEKDPAGNAVTVYANLIEDTLGKNPADGVKPRGVIHWVAAADAVDCEIRLYDRLFQTPAPDAAGENFLQHLNPNSLTVLHNAKAEPGLAQATLDDHYQFEREGYFYLDADSVTATSGKPKLIFNRTIELKDSWAKLGSN